MTINSTQEGQVHQTKVCMAETSPTRFSDMASNAKSKIQRGRSTKWHKVKSTLNKGSFANLASSYKIEPLLSWLIFSQRLSLGLPTHP